MQVRKITSPLEAWFRRHQRRLPWRETYDPYQVWVSEVMLQQTRMEVVLSRFSRFMSRFPSIAALAVATEEEVHTEWSGLGYYRRARTLQAGAKVVMESFGGELPGTDAGLRQIPGIGRYTAGAILSIAFNERAPIVDGNVARVLARLFALDGETKAPAQVREIWKKSSELVEVAATPRDFNQGMMELGAMVCRPLVPLCHECPVAEHCLARRRGLEREIPPPARRAETVNLVIPLWIVEDRAGALLFRLHQGPLMGGMFHLPHGSSALLGSSDDSFQAGALLGSFAHTVTNRRIRFDVFKAQWSDSIADRDDSYRWIQPHDLGRVPHSSYVTKALKIAGLI
ncbi:MAG TPA: A/G-specific adenine glycosylase [Thermoanaerobaculia bacterium]|nr:A/G-specific adenine glycosylase [Thermoanaerobaculia bacterium]